jgi:hypothetical protein
MQRETFGDCFAAKQPILSFYGNCLINRVISGWKTDPYERKE